MTNSNLLKYEINISEVGKFRIGQTENAEAGTGLTVFVFENGAPAGLDVRGGGPASRETELLKPLANAQFIHSVVLGGGSAFGLDAAGGVMQYLEEHDIGLDVGVTKVPLVVQSDIFDLSVGDKNIRPDKAMGYKACENAFIGDFGNYRDGNYGAGTGASVGKMRGMATAMKSGIGSFAVKIGDVKLGAVVAVNAVGDVFNPLNGEKIAGLITGENDNFVNSTDFMYSMKEYESRNSGMAENTTIGAVITNVEFDKTKLCKIASMSHNGYARTINPVHTMADGDSIYAVSVGNVKADVNFVGTLAAEVMAEAVVRAVKNCESAYGLKAYKDIK